MTQANVNLSQAILSGLGYANNIEPNEPRGGPDLGEWPEAGTNPCFLNKITMEPDKFRYKKSGKLVELDCISVRFWYTLQNDPAVAAGRRAEPLQWGGSPIELIAQAHYVALPFTKGGDGGNQKQRVDIQYGRLLGSLSALLGRKITMGEAIASIEIVNTNAQDATPVICDVLVSRRPRADKPKEEDKHEQVTAVTSM